MDYLISLAIGLLVGLLGMLLGEKLWPMGRHLVSGWLS